jgi:uncharacterized protein
MEAPIESFFRRLDPPVRGFLHRSAGSDGLILAHGAGSNAAAPLLVALAESFSAGGFTVLRLDLPYRQNRSYGPPGPADRARDRRGLENAVQEMKAIVQGRIFLGGHSYGGRLATMLCAEESGIATGLLLLSYPLHPPRKPEAARTAHLPDLDTPALFVHGTSDPLGTIEEMERARKMIPAKTSLLTVPGAGHDLGFKGKMRNRSLPEGVLAEFLRFFAALGSGDAT